MAENEIIALLKSYIFLLRSEGFAVDKAYLYGSYLSNKATKDSDIDLMIVTDKEYDDYLVGKVWSLTKKINSKIEPFLITSNRFNSNDDSPLVDLVKRTGLEIK